MTRLGRILRVAASCGLLSSLAVLADGRANQAAARSSPRTSAVLSASRQSNEPCRGFSCRGHSSGARATEASFLGTAYHASAGGTAEQVGGGLGGSCDGCVWVIVPSCTGNQVFYEGGTIYVVDNECLGSQCADGAGANWWAFLKRPTWDDFLQVDEVCVTPGSPIVTAEQLADAAQSAFTEDDVPVPTFAVQPNRPQVVLRKPVIGWITNHQTIDDPSFTEAFGIRIALRAYPEYHWYSGI